MACFKCRGELTVPGPHVRSTDPQDAPDMIDCPECCATVTRTCRDCGGDFVTSMPDTGSKWTQCCADCLNAQGAF